MAIFELVTSDIWKKLAPSTPLQIVYIILSLWSDLNFDVVLARIVFFNGVSFFEYLLD